jgi:hypothetical protein
MRYQVQIHNGIEWVTVQEVLSEELAYWTVASRQREGFQARVVEFSK